MLLTVLPFSGFSDDGRIVWEIQRLSYWNTCNTTIKIQDSRILSLLTCEMILRQYPCFYCVFAKKTLTSLLNDSFKNLLFVVSNKNVENRHFRLFTGRLLKIVSSCSIVRRTWVNLPE